MNTKKFFSVFILVFCFVIISNTAKADTSCSNGHLGVCIPIVFDTDKLYYNPGDTVNFVTGKSWANIARADITKTLILGPDGSTLLKDTSGNYIGHYTLSNTALIGGYTAIVYAYGNCGSYSGGQCVIQLGEYAADFFVKGNTVKASAPSIFVK